MFCYTNLICIKKKCKKRPDHDSPSSVDSSLTVVPQLLLCSLHEIYQALEEALDRNSNHPSVAPIYFPAELARLESVEKDLEHFYGQDWREKIVIPAATKRYAHRLRQVCAFLFYYFAEFQYVTLCMSM